MNTHIYEICTPSAQQLVVNQALLPASKTLYQLVKQQLAEANLQVMRAVLVLEHVLLHLQTL
jgi:hypothetical protein